MRTLLLTLALVAPAALAEDYVYTFEGTAHHPTNGPLPFTYLMTISPDNIETVTEYSTEYANENPSVFKIYRDGEVLETLNFQGRHKIIFLTTDMLLLRVYSPMKVCVPDDGSRGKYARILCRVEISIATGLEHATELFTESVDVSEIAEVGSQLYHEFRSPNLDPVEPYELTVERITVQRR